MRSERHPERSEGSPEFNSVPISEIPRCARDDVTRLPKMRYLGWFFFLPSSLYAASHNPTEFLEKIAGSANEGQQITEHYCNVCHAKKPQIPVGAPRIGEKSDWTQRMHQGLKTIYKHVDEGMPPMPPRGGCFECSDRQLKLAIMALLPE